MRRILVPLVISAVCLLGVAATQEMTLAATRANPADQAGEEPAPDRALTEQELEDLQKFSDILITKTFDSDANARSNWEGDRKAAAVKLLNLSHRHCLPALFAVVRDRSESPDLRVSCLVAIGHIHDKRVIEVYLESVADEHYNVSAHALVQLREAVSERSFTLDRDWPRSRKLEEIDKWRAWWRESYDEMEVISPSEPNWLKRRKADGKTGNSDPK